MLIGRYIPATLLLPLLFLALTSTTWAAASLRIAPLPMENREATVKAFNPIVEYLKQRLGQPIELVYFDKNHEIIQAFKDKAVDVAMLGSLPYLVLEKKGGKGEPLVLFREADGLASYRCVLVKASSDAVSLRSLRGKRIALTQPLSTCGYLGANAMLRQQAGISLENLKYRYLNTHEAAALAVVAGEAELASVKEEFARKFANLGLVILAYSEPVPALGLFANQATLEPSRIADIRRILLAAPEASYRNWGNSMRYGMTQAQDTNFESLRRFGDPASIPDGNAPNYAQ
jgi:phosphonate transport system substrate-binding protein